MRYKTIALAAMLFISGMASAQVVIKGSVHGGGLEGQVKNPKAASNVFGNATVTINDGTIEGSVYGGGKGVPTNETTGLVEGNTTVTMRDGIVVHSIYGGGELGSVGTFTATTTIGEVAIPTSCTTGTGISKVVISGGKVGRYDGKFGSKMPTAVSPFGSDDIGYIFAGSAGMGDSLTYPKVIAMGVVDSTYLEISKTETTSPLITASVYGGCENGLVLRNTSVKIAGGQIGTGYRGTDTWDDMYLESKWTEAIDAVKNGTIGDALDGSLANYFHECDRWDFVAPYEVYDYYYDSTCTVNANGTNAGDPWQPDNSANLGHNGHSFFGHVFGGGSGYYPIAPGVWRRNAGRVKGNATIEITGGHILSNVYGGNETTDVDGNTTITMTGGTVGIPRTTTGINGCPVNGYIYGAGMGDPRVLFNTWTNVDSSYVSINGGVIFSSVYGGGEEGHVLRHTHLTIDETAPSTKPTIIGTYGYLEYEGNVFGAGRGFTRFALTAGTIGGNSRLDIINGRILGNIYGGGSMASVGTFFTDPNDPEYGQMQDGPDHGHTVINITGGTIGNDYEAVYHPDFEHISNGGNVFGGSKGSVMKLDNTTVNPIWPNLAKVKSTSITIEDAVIKGCVYGGCEIGIVAEDTKIEIHEGSTIWRNVFGGGHGDNNYTDTVILAGNVYVPLRHAGRVYGNTRIDISGGWIKKIVYGGGEMGSVGTIKSCTPTSLTLSWPYNFVYDSIDHQPTGKTVINVTGGRIGITGKDYMGPWAMIGDAMKPVYYDEGGVAHELTGSDLEDACVDNGDIFGGCAGAIVDPDKMHHMANVRETEITVDYGASNTARPENYKPDIADMEDPEIGHVTGYYPTWAEWTSHYGTTAEQQCITGAVYAGAEEGHVNEDTKVTLDYGLVGHAIYGGGKGKGKYNGNYILTSGKVYGNTEININNGYVVRSVFGGGNLASVGKGNFIDIPGGESPVTGADSVAVANSGIATINILGGQLGMLPCVTLGNGALDSTSVIKDNIPYGSVFGGSRGQVVNSNTPSADFHAYVNKTNITIGAPESSSLSSPRLYGSVYGGGQDGHVRRKTDVTVNAGEIGVEFVDPATALTTVGARDWTSSFWTTRGNVYGGGSGISKKSGHYSAIAGSVYDSAFVTINGGLIHRNVYGGGSMSFVEGKATVTVNSPIGVESNNFQDVRLYDYGGYVFGAGRGTLEEGVDLSLFATTGNTEVNIGALVQNDVVVRKAWVPGDVFGGGPIGQVKENTDVRMTDGTVGTVGYVHKQDHPEPDPNPTLLDSIIHTSGGRVFGGGRGDLSKREAALVSGNAEVTISGGHVQYSVYGGGEVATVGLRDSVFATGHEHNAAYLKDFAPHEGTGNTKVAIMGGQVGPAPKKDLANNINVKIGLNGVDGYVFGGGKGVGDDPIDMSLPFLVRYFEIADVNNAEVIVNMPDPVTAADSVTNRLWGSVFGGAEDGHVLGNAKVQYISGLMGTTGTTSYDGNIFGGGRNYNKMNYSAGRVRGNDTVMMCGGTLYGSIFGGGRLALTGCGVTGFAPTGEEHSYTDMLDGDDHGNIFVKVNGGTIGNAHIIDTFLTHAMGDVFGGGKGTMDSLNTVGHPKAASLLLSGSKNTTVIIADSINNGTFVSRPVILGSVFGGGEVANVGQHEWKMQSYAPSTEIVGDIIIKEGTGKTKVTVSGGTIGATKAQMRYELASGAGNFNFKYNDDRGHVFGGGEGKIDNPANYATINPGTSGHNDKSLLDLMATVGETEVTISDTAFVKGAVYGGSMSGHVLGDTKVTVSGGQIGAGYNPTTGVEQAMYQENQFFNPVDYFSRHATDYDIHPDSVLLECVHWDYNPVVKRAYDPLLLKADATANKPTNRETWFGIVFGGGSGYYPYIGRTHDDTADSCIWNPEAGRVFGNAEVEITGGHILTNVYGGCQTTNVDGKAIVSVSGGTVGVPRTIDSIHFFPSVSNVYGGGEGDFREQLSALGNVDSTRVTISGNAVVYGSVFGGSQNGHVLDSTKVLVKGGVIGTTGLSGFDGDVLGGGEGSSYYTDLTDPEHPQGDTLYAHAGRVGGNTRVIMTDGKVLGNVFGGGFMALTGVGENGWFDAYINSSTHQYDSMNHGRAKVEVRGGFVGNDFNGGKNLLTTPYTSGNVYGGGRGKDEYLQDDFGRMANAGVKIDGSPTIYGSVYGGGKMANVGHWNNYDSWYTKGTGAAQVSIQGSPTIGTALEFVGGDDYSLHPGPYTLYDTVYYVDYEAEHYDTTYLRILSHTRTGNVIGGGQGDVSLIVANGVIQKVVGLEQGHCRATLVDISGDPVIRSSVFGGSEEGMVWGETQVRIAGGTIGSKDILSDSLKMVGHVMTPLANHATYSHGNVYGGSYGKDYYKSFDISNPRPQVVDSVNALAGRVYGNTHVDITGGTIRGNVFGGGDMASVGIWDTILDHGDLIGIVPMADPDRPTFRGNATVNISESDPTNHPTIIGPIDGTGLNGYVIGGGKGFHIDSLEYRKAFANVDSTFITINGGTIWGSVMGGGSDSHVLGSTSVIVHAGNIGTDGLSTFDGNIFGGGRNYLNTNHTNGRVAGNVNITVDGGTLQGSIFGGGRMALTGVDLNGDPYVTGTVYDSVTNGMVTINVSGTTDTIPSLLDPEVDSVVYLTSIGNPIGDDLLNGSDESVGDIFGSGKGDTKAYEDVWAGRVANTKINVSGSPRIYGSVFGGGEMAGIGYWHEVNDMQVFYEKSGTSEVTIGSSASDNPTIGTYYEFDPEYLTHSEHAWTVYDDAEGIVIHTCTGNVFGGSQGDVDPECPAWVSMGRSRTATVTVNGGTIMSRVFGGAEQGSMSENTLVTILGGNIGTLVTKPSSSDTYYMGGVHGGGYGSQNADYNGTTYEGSPITNDSIHEGDTLWTASYLAGRVYGDARVDVLGGTIKGDVYGGAAYAYLGGYGANPKGNTLVNIGAISGRDVTYSGEATILGSVFGANNKNGTPYGDVEVNIYKTAHTEDNEYPDQAPTTPQALGELSTDPSKFALKAVYAGSNHADYLPVAGKEATVHVWGCEENTIYDVYGGCDAAAIGSGTAGYPTNTNVIIDGGRIYQVFGGGNGSVISADIHGTANTDIKGGLINEVFGGSNNMGQIDDINLVINQEGDCDVVIADGFGGNNSADLIGDLVVTLECGDNPPSYGNFYCGSRLGDIYGNILVNVMGGVITNLFAGSRGQADDPTTHDENEAISADILEITQEFIDAHPEYSGLVAGHGGNITLNLYGGDITNAFGGSDIWSQIDGKITVNVLDTVDKCALNLTNVYGGGRHTPYTPLLVEGNKINSPEVNLIHGEIQGNVFGGALGDTATVAANPVVRIGYDPVAMAEIIEPYYHPGLHPTYFDPDTASVRVKGNVYGGGQQAQVDGNTTVNVYQGEVGEIGYTYKHDNSTHAVYDSIYHKEYDVVNHLIGGNVFGGGMGDTRDPSTVANLNTEMGRVTGNSTVNISGGHVQNNVYGGGEIGSLGLMDTIFETGTTTIKDFTPKPNTGYSKVTVTGGQVGPAPKFLSKVGHSPTAYDSINVPIGLNGVDGYVFGGGKGLGNTYEKTYDTIANVNFTCVTVNMPMPLTTDSISNRLWGSIFGGAEDGHVLGSDTVKFVSGLMGTKGTTSYDGNIFGGGRNYYHRNKAAGRVRDNIKVEMTGGHLLGNVYGGGRMGMTGVDIKGDTIVGINHGFVTVNISDGIVGKAVDAATTGNVFGSGKGIYDEPNNPYSISMMTRFAGNTKNTAVHISGTATIHGSVYGGGEIARVYKNTNVWVSNGTIGTAYGTPGETGYYHAGSVFGGSKGYDGYWYNVFGFGFGDVGEVLGNTTVTIEDGQVLGNVFGGGEIANVGQYIYSGSGYTYDECQAVEGTGETTVTIMGGEIGPLDGTGRNAHVYGGGKGDPAEPVGFSGEEIANVNNTHVTVEGTAHVYGSVFGGASDGHVAGDANVTFNGGIIGTDGMQQGWDGNIFGGGEGTDDSFTTGRVEGNTTVEMTHGTVYGNIYGGGRLALTGVDMNGTMQSGNDHGNTKVMVKGGTVGNEDEIEEFTLFSMGNIYGGGKGYLNTDTPSSNQPRKALLLGLTKNTTIEISDTLGNHTHVYGIVLGGGEIANVGHYTLTPSSGNITGIAVAEGTGTTKVKISGGIIGGDRTQMRPDTDAPGSPWLLYNDDLGYVYGGGEGWSDDPTAYVSVGDTSLLDLIATVQSTEVTVTNDTTKIGGAVGKPWVKASVFGGSESGHVKGDTKVTIAGGQIGAGYYERNNKVVDSLYSDVQFIDPTATAVTDANSLSGTAHWPYTSPYNPFDPALLSQGIEPTDGKSWFGNVFGGGSGWFPYVVDTSSTSQPKYESRWNPLSGKVWGNTEVIVTGGHILNNVYGANESTDVGGKATVKISGGTVGVPRSPSKVLEQPFNSYVFGGGSGDPRTVFDGLTLVDSTNVQITGGIIYGSVFGGAEDGHVLGDARVTINQKDHATVIGSTGCSGADGNVFGGGRNFMERNYKAGRVGGNTTVTMSAGTLLGSLYGGGCNAMTGIDEAGDMIVGDDHGKATIYLIGGTVGNIDSLFTHTGSSLGDVFGGGRGATTSSFVGILPENLGRLKNTEVHISDDARVLHYVYGGGEMASVGWYDIDGSGHYEAKENTGLAKIEISGGQVGVEQIGAPQAGIVGGNVYGGGLGLAGGKAALPFANVDTTHVELNTDAYVIGSVFGGADNGHVMRNTSVEMTGGTVGQRNTLLELSVDANEQPIRDHIYSGSVLAGGRGTTEDVPGHFHDTTGIVFGNATVSVTGGVVRHSVYGGGGLSHVGTFTRDASGDITFINGGKCTVTVAGSAHIGPTKADLVELAGEDNAKKNTFFDMLGANAGWVFGAGCGLANFPNLTFNDSTLVTIGSSAQVTGAVFGGGENGHVLDSTHVVINGGTIGGIPLHGLGSVTVSGGAFDGVSFNATTNELTEDIYGSGPRVFRGNVYGGGKGNDSIPGVSPFCYSFTAGRVYGNSKVEINGGTIYNRVFGGGLLASVGTFNYAVAPHDTDSIVSVVDGTGLAKVIVSGGTIGNSDDNTNNGDVFGGGRGLVGRHWEPDHPTNDQVVFLAYVGNTEVTIKPGATIYGNVYGGSGSGHVQENAHVIVEGGTIGIEGHGGWHSNVYGGGGGQHQYQRTPTTTHHSITSGRVYGDTKVEIKDGTIYHNVYGGGAIASVGSYDIYNPANYVIGNTGNTEVTITGGTIGVDGNENGMVFGSGRGQIAPIGAFMDSLSYAVKTVVNIGTEGSSSGPMVHGSVYGSGENGHTFEKATVNVYSGTIGCESYDPAHASHFANHGNVYGAGCGTDTYIEGGVAKYNPRSGIVHGNTEVNIHGGLVSHNVYGGGAMALVGTYLPYATNGTGLWGNDITGVSPFTGKTVVNITGGTIGTSDAPADVEHGCVFGGSRGPDTGDGFTNMALTDTTLVFISDTANVLGSVYGGGKKSLTRTARVVTISGGTVEKDVFGGSQDGLDDDDTHPFTSLKTVNVRAGTIHGDVFGCSDDAVEGDPSNTGYNPVWTSFVNVTGGTIGQNVYGAGKAASVNGSVCVNIGANAVKNAPTNTPSDENANVFMTEALSGSVEPAADTLLVINGSVYGGSQGGVTGWNNYDISQYAVIYIDGKGYNTQTSDPNETKYMNIGGGLYGCGTTCESGEKGRQVLLKNYGHRNTSSEGDEFTSATRSLTTIQRCGHVLLDSANVKLDGAFDITVANPSSPTNWKYGVLKVDTAMYVSDGSGIILGSKAVGVTPGNPVYMDSIRMLKSVLLAEGTVYDSALLYQLPWDSIGITNNDNKLYRIHHGSLAGALASNYENVILFNDTSMLFVRYTDRKPGDTKDTTYYGELQGFFRMRADSFEPKDAGSFAYARPKITDGSGNDNTSDGGFLSYVNAYNYFTDNGLNFSKTKQYPYVNVLGGRRGDRTAYRLWAYPQRGNVWYVDGRSNGWGDDSRSKKTEQAGLYPDRPKHTLFGMDGLDGVGVVTETYTGGDAIYNYCYKTDHIYVVGALTEFDGAALCDSVGPTGNRTPLTLYRYPGGHVMSNGATDEGNGSVPAEWGGVEDGAGPGANYGAMIDVLADTTITLNGVVVDGLSAYTLDDANEHMIPASFDSTLVTMPLVITHSGSTLTLQDSTVLKRGYNGNSTDATAWYDNSGYNTPADTYHGGALFVDAAATVNVCDTVFITGNKQKKGTGYVESNVFIPTFAAHLNIADSLSSITRIGVTKPRRNDESDYKYNTFSPVAVVTDSPNAADTAMNAWRHNNFYDDMDMFFVNGYTNENQRSTYYSASIPDYPGFIEEAHTTTIDPTRTLFFGWTWANVVRTEPADFDATDIDSREDLVWLASTVNGLNGETPTPGPSAVLKTDVDLAPYVWVPIGTKVGSATFTGNFDGQGHLIKNLSIDYIGKGDRRYGYDDYGLFGAINNSGSTLKRTFVVSGIVRPVGTANIGGLAGKLTGVIEASEAAVEIVTNDADNGSFYVGGLVGDMVSGKIRSSIAMPDITVADGSQYEYGGALVGKVEGEASLYNNLVNTKVQFEGTSSTVLGGVVGDNHGAKVKNSYVALRTGSSGLTASNFYGLVANANTLGTSYLDSCYVFNNDVYDDVNGSGNIGGGCGKFTGVSDTDTIGYMHADNSVVNDTALMVRLNQWVDAAGINYARWARPALASINGDLPVLLLENYDGAGHIGQGNFRSVGSYDGGPVLQYGGPIRDNNQLNSALIREKAGANNDYLFVYGDITSGPTDAAGSYTQSKVSIHEDAAITDPGTLVNFNNTYVGITFDNSSRLAQDFYGNILTRDWHMMSSPLQSAPLGVNYDGDENQYGFGVYVDPPYALYAEDVQDGYLPSRINDVDFDLFTWYEPDYQWINFKRNGVSHWHYDNSIGNHGHEHIEYHYDNDVDNTLSENKNETNLVPGKGYMVSIMENTFLQSHGALNAGDGSGEVTYRVTTQAPDGVNALASFCRGHNLLGNPFHSYLYMNDFEGDNDLTCYYVYDADVNSYVQYPRGGSRGGAYASQYVHPHQGFFVIADPSSSYNVGGRYQDVTFKTTYGKDRTDATDSDFRGQPNYTLVNMYVVDPKGNTDILVIETDRPKSGGGIKAKGLRTGNHLLYAHYEDEDYGALFAERGTKQVPVRFRTYDDNGVYLLNWTIKNGEYSYLHLIDHKMGVDYDMLESDAYAFAADRLDSPSRFTVVFEPETDPVVVDPDAPFVFYDGNQWVVNGRGLVKVVDVLGNEIYTTTFFSDQNSLHLEGLAKGMYLIHLMYKDTIKTQKIIVK